MEDSTVIINPIPWPNGARCAVAFTWDVDVDTTVHVNYPDTADDHLATLSLMRYEPAVAVPRILALFKQYQIPLTFFIPGWVIENYPEMIERIMREDHEIAHHGYLHHDNNGQSRSQESATLEQSLDILGRVTGRKQPGYRSPNTKSNGVSRNTIDLLIEKGFKYDSSLFGDDIPYVLATDKGKLFEVPCAHGMDDWKHYMNWRDFNFMMPISSPARAHEVFRAEFDAAWTYGGMWMCVWHPAVSGRLARCAAIQGLIQHMQEVGGVWFASVEQIVEHVRKLINDGVWKPRVDQLPYCVSPIPAIVEQRKRLAL